MIKKCKSGTIRRLDELGRITLPSGMREALGCEERAKMVITMDEDSIVLRKYQENDIFTGEAADLVEYHGKYVSKKNIAELAKLIGITN